jgi:DNA-binding MarR family transcriptional regulator
MSDTNPVDSHRLSAAFVANQLERLVEVMVTQGNEMLDAAGIRFPSRAVSTVLFVGENEPTTTADIARALGQPHQLATQRVDLLTGMGIIERISDPDDARRKLLRLTSEGRDQFTVLTGRLEKAGQAFEALFVEIGCDLPDVSHRAADALHKTSLLTRMKEF